MHVSCITQKRKFYVMGHRSEILSLHVSGRTRQPVDCVDLRHRNCRTRGGKNDKHDVEYKLRYTRQGDTRPDTYLLHIQTRIIISSLVCVPGQVVQSQLFNHGMCAHGYVIQHNA